MRPLVKFTLLVMELGDHTMPFIEISDTYSLGLHNAIANY